jgi:hypothetical protein
VYLQEKLKKEKMPRSKVLPLVSLLGELHDEWPQWNEMMQLSSKPSPPMPYYQDQDIVISPKKLILYVSFTLEFALFIKM